MHTDDATQEGESGWLCQSDSPYMDIFTLLPSEYASIKLDRISFHQLEIVALLHSAANEQAVRFTKLAAQ